MPAKGFCDPAKESYWRKTLEEFENSSMSGMEFCRQNNIKYAQFSDWRQRIRKRAQQGLEITELTDEQWISLIESARTHPQGVDAFLKANNINSKAYYKRFHRLRKDHPEWKSLQWRKGIRRNYKRKAKTTSTEVFVPVQVIDANKSASQAASAQVEIQLPNAVILRVDSNCSIDFAASLVAALGGK